MPWRCMGSGCTDPSVLTSALVRREWSASRPGRFIPESELPSHWIGGWVGPIGSLDDMEQWKISTLTPLERRFPRFRVTAAVRIDASEQKWRQEVLGRANCLLSFHCILNILNTTDFKGNIISNCSSVFVSVFADAEHIYLPFPSNSRWKTKSNVISWAPFYFFKIWAAR
jgi:hypothetical protein